jgi:UPF0755 protein
MYEFHVEDEEKEKLRRSLPWKAVGIFVVLLGFFFVSFSFFMPPKNFPTDKIITIENGSSLEAISEKFEAEGLVRSAGIFKTFVLAFTSDKNISIGDYLFEKPVDVLSVAKRIAFGEFGVKKIVVTFPEGFTNKEMAQTLSEKMPNFNQEEFLFLTKDLEGYLFPDTYYFFGSAKTEDIVKTLRDNFNKKVSVGLSNELESSSRDFGDIVKMASIVEAEAYDGKDEKQIVAGILWKKLDKGMRLQVDATSGYEYGKEPSQITASDLDIDSPYNTYLNDGFPPTPIGNPGLESIKAAINPKASEYFFYLHDKDAKIHYAKTYEEHKKNIAKYLK